MGSTFAGLFLLTNLLLDNMKKIAKETGVEGRIVNLSSVAHFLTYDEGIRLLQFMPCTGIMRKHWHCFVRCRDQEAR